MKDKTNGINQPQKGNFGYQPSKTAEERGYQPSSGTGQSGSYVTPNSGSSVKPASSTDKK